MSDQLVKVKVWGTDGIFGSMISKHNYDDDLLSEVIAHLTALLLKVPEEFRKSAKINIDSVGGYEDGHHAEMTVYYERPETAQEKERRIREIESRRQEEIRIALLTLRRNGVEVK